MHTSTLTRAAGMALVAAMLVPTSGLAGAKLPALTEEQKAQTDLARVRAAWGDKVAAFQTYKAQDKAMASHQAGGKTAYTRPGAPCVNPGPFVAPVSAASIPVPVAKGRTVGSNVACSSSGSITVCSPNEP